MTEARICSACRQRNDPAANFCRQCGARVDTAESAPVNSGVAPTEAGESGSAWNDQGLLRQLCWLCGLPIAISVICTVCVRVAGRAALIDLLAVSAMALVAAVAAFLNARVVGSALRLPAGRDFLATLLIGLVLMPGLVATFWLLEHVGFRVDSDYLSSYLDDGWPRWVGYADVALVTPISEEVLFRGVIQPKLSRILTPTEALIVQAALFSALHLSPVILLTHFAMGLAFGWLRKRSNSLLPGILLHGAWNAWVLWSSPV